TDDSGPVAVHEQGGVVGDRFGMSGADKDDIAAALLTHREALGEGGEGTEKGPRVAVAAGTLAGQESGAIVHPDYVPRLHLQQGHSPHTQPIGKALRVIGDGAASDRHVILL